MLLETLAQELSARAKLWSWLRSRVSWSSLRKVRIPAVAAVLFTSGSEAMPKAVPLTHANLLANKWNDVEVFPVGLAGQPGVYTLFGISSTGASLIQSWAAQTKRFQRTIPVSTLDILLGNRFQGKKVFIKLDVEGFEYEVLKGCRNILTMYPRPTWMVEVCLNEFHPNGMNPHYKETFDMFFDSGYKVRTADVTRKEITSADIERYVIAGRSSSGTINYLFEP